MFKTDAIGSTRVGHELGDMFNLVKVCPRGSESSRELVHEDSPSEPSTTGELPLSATYGDIVSYYDEAD